MTEQAIQTKRTDLFLIDPRNIVVVEGFNVRREFDLEELKEQIKDKGVLNPVTVIPLSERRIPGRRTAAKRQVGFLSGFGDETARYR